MNIKLTVTTPNNTSHVLDIYEKEDSYFLRLQEQVKNTLASNLSFEMSTNKSHVFIPPEVFQNSVIVIEII